MTDNNPDDAHMADWDVTTDSDHDPYGAADANRPMTVTRAPRSDEILICACPCHYENEHPQESDDALRAALVRVVELWALDDTCLRNQVDRFVDHALAALRDSALATSAPPPDVEGLDTHRLARALRRAQYDSYRDDPSLANSDAEDIAREYAALRESGS